MRKKGLAPERMKEEAACLSPERRKKILRITMIATVSICLVVALLLSPLFAISEVSVTPMSHYNQEDIEYYLQSVMGRNGFLAVADQTTLSQSQHILSMEMPKIAERILFELPYLKSIKVRYVFPNKIKVQVQERTASFLLEYYGIYLLLDTHGVVLETFTKEDCPDMPVVKGVEIDTYKIGVPISKGKDAHIDTAIQICNMMQQLSMENYIDIIDVTDYNDIQLYCAPALTILFGNSSNVGVRLTELKGILDASLDGNSNGVLDMRSGGHPTFVKNEDQPKPEEESEGESDVESNDSEQPEGEET